MVLHVFIAHVVHHTERQILSVNIAAKNEKQKKASRGKNMYLFYTYTYIERFTKAVQITNHGYERASR